MGVGYFFADIELSMELWTVIAGVSGSMIRSLQVGHPCPTHG